MEWTDWKLCEALRKAENREGWSKVVARLFLVPQRSSIQKEQKKKTCLPFMVIILSPNSHP